MTREDFFDQAARTGQTIYMFSEQTKRAWEKILPENGIKSFYRLKYEQLEDETYDSEYLVLTNEYLFDIFVTKDSLNSKAYRFNPYCIEKNFRIINDFGYKAKIDEIKIYMVKDDSTPIVVKKSEQDYSDNNFINFINGFN